MYLRSFFDEKLAQYAYLIGCQRTGEAIVIDPPRDSTEIQAVAKKEGLRITAATETHIHADFVSGSRQLAHDTNAHLYLSDEGDADWKYQYTDGLDVTMLKDGSTFSIGNIDFEVMHTPGHTPESISFVLTDRGGGATNPLGIFTGDFVFVGDIGRPDLLEKAAGVKESAEKGARQMYNSIQRFKALPDYLMVWPGHGAGSACGKSLGAVPSSTVGYERQFNWALKEEDEAAFVAELLKDQPEAPVYFAEMKKVNKMGPAILEDRHIPEMTDKAAFEAALNDDNTFVLDTRPASVAEKTLAKGAINIPFNKAFTNWAGWLVKYDEKIVVIADEANRTDIVDALQSIHLDNVVAFVSPSLLSEVEVTSYDTVDVDQFKEEMDNSYVMDVRNDVEWNDGHIDDAHHHFLGKLRETTLPKDTPVLMHCQGGARSAIGASVLKSLGFEHVKHLAGGYGAYEKSGGKK
ncbi:MBL fold metallo-hydrolase [Paenisporosarcina cavernae]|uniref:MBL fold metallo-hydrolase n=1 Tax=Paenisporosarcina cavernae TaxID=2320858 RepID=A0A385YQH2_9BACL|nr:MBL fold metallo-hydrolase [Paenisporosarcina cavernae]AYC28985.1 MBL fold metallo-hydrolase [Paenisporosarcina cavernae]